jgi:hypothetical protein
MSGINLCGLRGLCLPNLPNEIFVALISSGLNLICPYFIGAVRFFLKMKSYFIFMALLLAKIRRVQMVFFQELIKICAVLARQFGGPGHIASAEFNQLPQILTFKVLFGVL